jgi:hypothetical protein
MKPFIGHHVVSLVHTHRSVVILALCLMFSSSGHKWIFEWQSGKNGFGSEGNAVATLRTNAH